MYSDIFPWLLASLLAVWMAGPEAQAADRWLQGYARSVTGEVLQYHSADPTVNSGLLIRSLEQDRFIEWETEPAPGDLGADSVTFVWLFGMAAGTDPRRFELSIDGVHRLEFVTPRDARQLDWSVNGSDGSSLRFRATLVDRYQDLFGYATLTLPASQVTPGEPLRLRVAGESAGSRTWYMTCLGTVEAGLKVSGVGAIVKQGERRVRPVIVDLVHLGEPADVTLVTSAGERQEQRIVFGANRFELAHPVNTIPEEVRVSVIVGEAELYAGRAQLQPVRPCSIYMVQHTHTDIGYTRPQTEILPEHLRYIDLALDFCDMTDDWPEEARFRWTCETSWAVKEYLDTRPARQIERLRQRVAEGRIEVTGMFLNMSEVTDEAGYQAFLQPVRRFQEAGLRVTTAMQNDVNGVAWCLADALGDAGIRYVTMGQHGHRALVPFDRPTVFWWESPSGRRLLAYRADHYNTGNFWAVHGGHLETVEGELFRYLQNLESKEYPFDRVAVQYSGTFTDNSPPSLAGCDLIRRWNEKYEWPRLKSSIAREFLEFVEREHGDRLPVHRAAWPDWWTDGFGSAPRELAAVRATQAELVATEGLLALERLLGAELPARSGRRL
ncbi:MAG: glycosyl hydrolase family 38, partial [Planctomycetota bacterium]